MEKQLGQEYPEEERIKFLKDNCDYIEEMGYMKPFTSDMMKEKKENLSEVDIDINDLEEKKKSLVQDIKNSLKPMKESRRTLLKDIKQKAEFVTEQCYKFIDQEERMVGFYNSEGNLIESRPCNAKELQGTIFQIGRTGTNN